MATEGFKPGDFYLGVYELFAILLPGAILTYLVWRLDLKGLIEHAGAPLQNLAPGGGTASYLTLAVLSYVLGHFLAAFGWALMDPVFEAQRHRFPRLERRESQTVKIVGQREIDDPFPWALAYLDAYYPVAAGKLDAIEADSKFFRNLIPALLLCLPVIDTAYSKSRWGWGPIAETIWILGLFGYVAVGGQSLRLNYPRIDAATPVPSIYLGITSLWWLALLMAVPVIINNLLSEHDFRRFLIDVGIWLTALLAGARYMLLQFKRMTVAYDYLLAVLSPAPKGA